ncbi:MAG TPA: J domain-containing protein [Candidatus Limnocylindrales bacterium]|nr:J domain-containing protein [Candidatus Limnocylindrales bacterium]
MPKRDPHDILGVDPGASPTQIKAAWRRLARTHHPDLTGDDPAASRIATQRMAEINDAYAALTRDGGRLGTRWAGPDVGASDAGPAGTAGRGTAKSQRGGPPKPKATRPVTARVDTTWNVRPRNQTLHVPTGGASGPIVRAQPPLRVTSEDREPPRASTPTGPLARSRVRNFRRPAAPPLQEALDLELAFGKFHGHTLGQIAAFEPSYIDWLAATITRDPDLIAAARVVRAELDRKGVARRARAAGDVAGSGRSA